MKYRLTVRGFHLDLYGHVNNARYLEFLEEARWELLADRIDLDAWHKRGLAFTVVRITINYRRAASLGDVLDIHTTLDRIEKRTCTFAQKIVFADSDECVAEAEVTFVMVDTASGTSVPVTGDVRAMLERLA